MARAALGGASPAPKRVKNDPARAALVRIGDTFGKLAERAHAAGDDREEVYRDLHHFLHDLAEVVRLDSMDLDHQVHLAMFMVGEELKKLRESRT